MARDHGRVYASIWDDPDFIALTPTAQRLYLFLLTQADLSQCGLIAMRLRRWASRSAEQDVDALRYDLAALDEARFIVVDHETEEVLIRTFIRNDKVWRQPNVMKTAVRDAAEILSPALRSALAAEVSRLDVSVLSDTRGKGDSPSPREVVAACVGTLLTYLTEGAGNPSGTLPGTLPTRVPATPPVRVSPTTTTTPTTSPSTATPPADRAAVDDEAPETDDGAVRPETSPEARAGAAPSSPDPILDIAEQLAVVTGQPIEDVVLGTIDDDPGPDSAQTLLAEWIDHCGQRPPGRVIGHVARELKTMLDEGIPIDDVRTGFATWHQRGLHPSALASVVHETRTADQRRPRDRQTDILRAEFAAAQAADAARDTQPLALGSTL